MINYNSLKKAGRNALIVGGLGLAGLLGYSLRKDNDSNSSAYAYDYLEPPPSSFNGFGYFRTKVNQNPSSLSAAFEDLDGDGDKDIVVSSNEGYIFLLENKIPQANK